MQRGELLRLGEGVLILCAGFGAGTTAVSVCADMTGGIIDRLRTLDVSGAAVLTGHVAASLVRTVALAWCGGILAVSVAASGLLFARRHSRDA